MLGYWIYLTLLQSSLQYNYIHFFFQFQTKIITMVDSTSATYVIMSHDELTSLRKSSARTCNRVGWTTHKLNIDWIEGSWWQILYWYHGKLTFILKWTTSIIAVLFSFIPYILFYCIVSSSKTSLNWWGDANTNGFWNILTSGCDNSMNRRDY